MKLEPKYYFKSGNIKFPTGEITRLSKISWKSVLFFSDSQRLINFCIGAPFISVTNMCFQFQENFSPSWTEKDRGTHMMDHSRML